MKSMLGLCVFPSTHARFVFICLVLFTCLTSIMGNVQASTNWSSEYLFRQDNFELSGQNTLLFDAQNNPWIFLSGDTVQAMYHSGNEWITYEISESPASGLSALLDDSDHPIIVFTDLSTRSVKLAIFTGSAWNTATLDSSGQCIENVGFFKDSTGCIHVFYMKLIESLHVDLMHLYTTPSGLQSEVVYTASTLFDNIAVMETSPGVLGIAFSAWYATSGSPCMLHYMSPVVANGTPETIETLDIFQKFTSIRLVKDSSGQPRVLASYGARGGPIRLLYGTRTSSGWISGYPFDGVMEISDPGAELLIDETDTSHLFFSSGQNLVQAWKVGDNWNSETRILETGEGGSIAAGYDRSGFLQTAIVVHRNVEDDQMLYYGMKGTDGWTLTHIKSGGGQIRAASACADPDGTIYCAFLTPSQLKIATRESDVSQIHTLQDGVSNTDEIDIALDPFGNIGILLQFFDGTSAFDLFLWERKDGVWSRQLVRHVTETTCSRKLVYSMDGSPHAVYFQSDLENRVALRHAFYTSDGWVDQPIDLGSQYDQVFGATVDLEKSPDGTIHFFSIGRTSIGTQEVNAMYYGTLGDSGWEIETRTIDITTNQLSNAKLVFDDLEYPHAAFIQYNALFQATRTNSGWSFEQIAPMMTMYQPGLLVTADDTVWTSAAGSWDGMESMTIWKKDTAWTPELVWRRTNIHVETALLGLPGGMKPACVETRIMEGDVILHTPNNQTNCTEWETTGTLNATHFTSGMPFLFDLEICNPSEPLDSAVVVSCLEIQGEYFFHPSWSQTFDFEPLSVPSGWTTVPILHFNFTDPITFSIESLHLYGALLSPDLSEVMGPIWQQEFSIGPE